MPMPTREEQNRYQLAWITQRRTAWIEANGPCRSCGSSDRLEVDHIDPALKTMQPRSIWSRRADVRDAELANCQVLCHDCHKTKTISAYPDIPHGSERLYNLGCRCSACRAAHAARARDYRRRRHAAA